MERHEGCGDLAEVAVPVRTRQAEAEPRSRIAVVVAKVAEEVGAVPAGSRNPPGPARTYLPKLKIPYCTFQSPSQSGLSLRPSPLR